MSCKCEEEFNPWPSFVDIFSSVILVLLLFLLVMMANLAFQSQYKYRVSYTGTIANEDLIMKNNKTMKQGVPDSKEKYDPAPPQKSASTTQAQEESTIQSNAASAKTGQIESAITEILDKTDTSKKSQVTFFSDDYMLVSYKADEVIIDDAVTKELKAFLGKYSKDVKITIYAKEIKNQVSATISKQISLARTITLRNLIQKLGYEKKNLNIDLINEVEIKEKVDDTNGYIIVKIKK